MEPSGRPSQSTSASDSYSVVVSLGTDHRPFPRLVDWVDQYLSTHPNVSCLLQHGSSRPSHMATSVPELSHAELVERYRQASVVVVPGEPSAVLGVRKLGMVPLVIPRVAARGEHEDDHQTVFTDHMVCAGHVRRPQSAAQLATLLDAALSDPSTLRTGPRRTHSGVLLDRPHQEGFFTRVLGRPSKNSTPRHRSQPAA